MTKEEVQERLNKLFQLYDPNIIVQTNSYGGNRYSSMIISDIWDIVPKDERVRSAMYLIEYYDNTLYESNIGTILPLTPKEYSENQDV